MKLIDVIDAYVTLQRSLGMRFEAGRKLLRQFSREMGNPHIDQVRSEAVANFLQGKGALSATWTLKYRVLSGLYRFAISRGHVQSSPLPTSLPQLPPQQSPYVYSTDQLRRLLDATSALHVGHSRLQAPMYRTLLLLLYGSGLRIGEALAVTLRDVDLADQVIVVRNTKFFKTRLVPIGSKLAQELAAHIELRRQLPLPAGDDSPLFTTRTGRGWPYQHVITLFQRVRQVAGIDCPTGELRPPRLHDLRHTAAVHRVLAWYRSGEDVQRLLPQLATYLGHIDIKSTQRYLQMTPELLQEASQRFACYSQWGNGHE
jgi:site-specific recombinase XerD